VFNPATGEQESEVRLASKTDLDNTVEIAKKAFETWSLKPSLQRARIIFKFKELIEKNSEELTNLIVREVYQDGSKDTVLVEKANHSIDIPVNRHVLLEFVCPGHVTKRVAFNTDIPLSLQNIPFFDLVVELVEVDFLNSLENKDELKTLMDFPIGYIKFDIASNNWYNSQLSFTKTINKLIKKSLK